MKRAFTIPRKTQCSGQILLSWQSVAGNFLVTTGSDHILNVFDRHGEKQLEFGLIGRCCGLSWDKDGAILSIICEHAGELVLWDSNTKKLSYMETGLRDSLTLAVWSKSAPLLAVGTIKGNLLIYNYRTSRKVPVLGKHSKQITCGAWSQQNYLALVGNDKMLSLSNSDGDTMFISNLKGDPSLVQFSSMKQDGPGGGESTVSLILNKKSLFLVNIHDPDDPIVLSFQEKYGSVVDYRWHGEGYILLGFSSGFFILLSTLLKEIGQELGHVQCFNSNLVHMTVCISDNKVVGCGDDNKIKTYDIKNLRDMQHLTTVDDERMLDWIDWTDDGQLLAVSSPEGSVHVYITKLPVLGSFWNFRLAHLSSLYEVTIDTPLQIIKIDIEPKFLALGEYHIAIGMNNRVWFYNLYGSEGLKKKPDLLYDKEYLGTLQTLMLNSYYASALIEGKIQLHFIDEQKSVFLDRDSKIFPDIDEKNTIITCLCLTSDFLIYGTDTGHIQIFSLQEWEFSVSAQHPTNSAIKCVSANTHGTRILVVDVKGSAYIFNPIEISMLPVPNFRSASNRILWDQWPSSENIFIVVDEEFADSYICVSHSLEGGKIEFINSFEHNNLFPGSLINGELTFITPTGKTSVMSVPGHSIQIEPDGQSPSQLEDNFQAAIKLRRFRDAYKLGEAIQSETNWNHLAKSALYDLNIEIAIKVYRKLKDSSKVLSLEKIKDVEDTKLLCGHIAELFYRNYDTAQELYLMSSNPYKALEMRENLLHWDKALKLAFTLSPGRVPYISKEYAEQLEFLGDYATALTHYENGLIDNVNENHHNKICKSGIAKMSIRCGDFKRGTLLVEEVNEPPLYAECAKILEEIKMICDAAILYEKGGFYDKAALLYIKVKNWKKVKEYLPSVTSPRVHAQYAKAKEADMKYVEAAESYEKAKEYEDAIRIYLDYLKDPNKAARLVKISNSQEGARMVARFFQDYNDFPSAIKFLVLSQCKDEALVLAQTTDNMDVYANAIEDFGKFDDHLNIAVYYEKKKNLFLAGKYFLLAGRNKKALKMLLQVTGQEENEAIDLAIQAVGKAKEDHLTRQLINHIMGDADGAVKELKHLFKLYMTLGQIKEAARTAVIMASEEQATGTFRSAHSILLSMYKELKLRKMRIPSEMSNSLMLLHSYILVKYLIHKDSVRCSRMLIRVCNNISKFSSHSVQILTTAVLQCFKSGLKASAHKYAVILMRPEYRQKVDEKYKKKIENIIRKSDKAEIEEPATPCPYCSALVPESILYCDSCRYNIPYCIVTGLHIVTGDLTICPKCGFPARRSDFLKLLESENSCPMCSEELSVEDIVLVDKFSPENVEEESEKFQADNSQK